MDIILKIENLIIGYDNKAIAKNINLLIPRKEITSLLGINGIGKSTFLKTLLNIINPLAGKIYMLDKDISKLKPIELASMIGYVPQLQKNIPNFLVNDFILMGRVVKIPLFKNPSKIDQKIVDNYLDLMKIKHLKYRSFLELSGGEQKLVLITRSLVQEPLLILMDEPTASLDIANQILVLESILELKKQGYSIIFSTHQPMQAKLIASNLLIINNKRIEFIDNPNEYINADNMAKLYNLNKDKIKKYMGI